MVDISNNIKDLDNINITKFSNKLYSEFKSFMNKLSDFDNYIKNYEIKIDKKYEGKKYLMFLKKKFLEMFVQFLQKNIKFLKINKLILRNINNILNYF